MFPKPSRSGCEGREKQSIPDAGSSSARTDRAQIEIGPDDPAVVFFEATVAFCELYNFRKSSTMSFHLLVSDLTGESEPYCGLRALLCQQALKH
jgi:hypothetical protein